MKEIKITQDDKSTNFTAEGFSDFEIIGILGHYKLLMAKKLEGEWTEIKSGYPPENKDQPAS